MIWKAVPQAHAIGLVSASNPHLAIIQVDILSKYSPLARQCCRTFKLPLAQRLVTRLAQALTTLVWSRAGAGTNNARLVQATIKTWRKLTHYFLPVVRIAQGKVAYSNFTWHGLGQIHAYNTYSHLPLLRFHSVSASRSSVATLTSEDNNWRFHQHTILKIQSKILIYNMNFLPYDTTTSMYYVKSTNCFYLLLVTTNDSKAREDEVLPLYF